jgi:lipopolysaccharide/colanic/teichoic acid biosynthesis glycosyltransferase
LLKFVQKTRTDKLPVLVNVLRGEVGLRTAAKNA